MGKNLHVVKLLYRIKQKSDFFLSTTGVLFLLYIFYVIRLHLQYERQIQTCSPQNLTILFSGFITLFLLVRIINLLAGEMNLLRNVLSGFLIGLYIILSTYHLRVGTILDYSVLADNWSLALYGESVPILLGVAHRGDYILLASGLALTVLIGWKRRRLLGPLPYLKGQMFLTVVVYVLCLQFLPYSYDEITSFAQTAYQYYIVAPEKQFKVAEPGQKFPYIKESTNAKKNNPPNIFIILVESFNANFVNTLSPEGRQYTPFFNSLTRDGTYLDNFWGSSIQTAKGHLSALCSVIPLTRQKVFTDFPDLNLRCLPKIMADNDYETLFFQGNPHQNFDNEAYFLRRNGFKQVHSMNEKFISESERLSFLWGWGIQDDVLYQKTFQYLDKMNETLSIKQKTPKYFVVLATISSHMKFKDTPESQRFLYKNPGSRKQLYANAIRAADEYLKTFFEKLRKRDYLRNSIVIISGDHSFPVGEHGYYDSESGFYNEYFRIPLLIWGNGITPRIIHEARSQLDIAPTVMQLTGISAKVHFRGESVFSKEPSFIPLVQPYAGVNLGIISYPYKYIYARRSQKEYLFDLSNDPNERTNIIDMLRSRPLYRVFHRKIGEILLNDKLIRENRIWPPTG
jgi:hypothetical protein